MASRAAPFLNTASSPPWTSIFRWSMCVISVMLSSVRVSTGISFTTRPNSAKRGKQPSVCGSGVNRLLMPGAWHTLQRLGAAAADRVGQVGFEVALFPVELFPGVLLRLEPDHAAEALPKQLLVGRGAVDRIGADVDDGGETLGTQQVEQRVGLGVHGVEAPVGRPKAWAHSASKTRVNALVGSCYLIRLKRRPGLIRRT